jgi:hypothetical protein
VLAVIYVHLLGFEQQHQKPPFRCTVQAALVQAANNPNLLGNVSLALHNMAVSLR